MNINGDITVVSGINNKLNNLNLNQNQNNDNSVIFDHNDHPELKNDDNASIEIAKSPSHNGNQSNLQDKRHQSAKKDRLAAKIASNDEIEDNDIAMNNQKQRDKLGNNDNNQIVMKVNESKSQLPSQMQSKNGNNNESQVKYVDNQNQQIGHMYHKAMDLISNVSKIESIKINQNNNRDHKDIASNNASKPKKSKSNKRTNKHKRSQQTNQSNSHAPVGYGNSRAKPYHRISQQMQQQNQMELMFGQNAKTDHLTDSIANMPDHLRPSISQIPPHLHQPPARHKPLPKLQPKPNGSVNDQNSNHNNANTNEDDNKEAVQPEA